MWYTLRNVCVHEVRRAAAVVRWGMHKSSGGGFARARFLMGLRLAADFRIPCIAPMLSSVVEDSQVSAC